MNRREAAELSPFIKAFGEGKDIEMRSKNPHAQLNGWAKMDEFIFGNFEYRIKPESKYRPFKDAKECWQEMLKHQPLGWVKVQDLYRNIANVMSCSITFADNEARDVSYEQAFKNYTFADGVPFGVKIKDDYNGIK